jgi:hypothetical protein
VTNGIQEKFTSNVDTIEEQLKAETVGLVTLNEMKEKHLELKKKDDEVVVGKIIEPTKSSTSLGLLEKTVQVISLFLFNCIPPF